MLLGETALLKTEVKVFIITGILFIVGLIFTFKINFNIYDKNSYLSPIDNILLNIKENRQNKVNAKEENSYYIVNIYDSVPSKLLYNLLNFFIESEADSIILDAQKNFIKDEEVIASLENIIKTNDKIFGLIDLNIEKGISFNYIDFFEYKNLYNLLPTLPDQNLFYLASCIKPPLLKESIVPAEKIGFVNRTAFFDHNNIDLLYKINDKVLFSLPFLIKSKKDKVDLNRINFNFFSVKLNNKIYYYDQKGRMSFLSGLYKEEKVENFNISSFEDAYNSMLKALELLNELNIPNLPESGSERLNIISTLPQLNDITKNRIITEAKELVIKWNAYKKGEIDKIKNKIVLISGEKNGWIKNFAHQKRLLDSNKNLMRLPVEIIFVSFIALFLLVYIFLRKNKNFNFVVILSLLFFILTVVLRNFLCVDFPLSGLLFTLFASTLLSFVTESFEFSLMSKEIRLIFKDSISKEYLKKIIYLIKNKKWSPEQKEFLCTFMDVDLSDLLNRKIDDSYIDVVNQLHKDITNIIKRHYGVVNEVSNLKIIAVFGNPDILDNHAEEAVKASEEILEKIKDAQIKEGRVVIAIHSKKEWFKLVENEFGSSYSFVGQAVNILSAMIKYAKKFNAKVLISEPVFKLCNLEPKVRLLDRVRVTEINQTFRFLELLTGREAEEKEKLLNYFHAGVKLFVNKRWDEASKYFKQCLKIDQDDIASKIFMERCKEYKYVEPESDWDGVFELDLY